MSLAVAARVMLSARRVVKTPPGGDGGNQGDCFILLAGLSLSCPSQRGTTPALRIVTVSHCSRKQGAICDGGGGKGAGPNTSLPPSLRFGYKRSARALNEVNCSRPKYHTSKKYRRVFRIAVMRVKDFFAAALIHRYLMFSFQSTAKGHVIKAKQKCIPTTSTNSDPPLNTHSTVEDLRNLGEMKVNEPGRQKLGR